MPKPLLTPYSLHLEGGQCQVGKENDDKVELGVTRFTLYLEKWAKNRTMCDGKTNANEIITWLLHHPKSIETKSFGPL